MIGDEHTNPALADELPETYALLLRSGLQFHEAVDRVTLHGSRGPGGGARPDSDLDLCLVVGDPVRDSIPHREDLFGKVLETALESWRNDVELDVAVVFDMSGCGLRCLDHREHLPGLCPGMVGCMGVYKRLAAWEGIVPASEVDCRKMYPLMTIWDRTGTPGEAG